MEEYIACPFCKEGEYDLPGLAWHLAGSCDEYDDALQDFVDEKCETLRSWPTGGSPNEPS